MTLKDRKFKLMIKYNLLKIELKFLRKKNKNKFNKLSTKEKVFRKSIS